MAPYFGLRGNALSRAIMALVVAPAFTVYGYNLSAPGGLLTLKAFNEQFPQMDTFNATSANEHERSLMQGQYFTLSS